MKTDRRTVVSSAQLPSFVVEDLVRGGAAGRPRLEVVFDPNSRLILGFKVSREAADTEA